MAKTPGQPKRGKGGRFVADAEPAPEDRRHLQTRPPTSFDRILAVFLQVGAILARDV